MVSSLHNPRCCPLRPPPPHRHPLAHHPLSLLPVRRHPSLPLIATFSSSACTVSSFSFPGATAFGFFCLLFRSFLMTSTTASSSSPSSTFPDGAVMIPDESLAPLMAFFRLSSSEFHSPSEFLTAGEMKLLSSTALGGPPRVLLHCRLLPILHSLGNNIGGHDALHGGAPCSAARSLPLVSVIPSALLSFSLCPSSLPLDHSSPNPPLTNPLISTEFVKLSTSDAASTAPLHLPPLRLRAPFPHPSLAMCPSLAIIFLIDRDAEVDPPVPSPTFTASALPLLPPLSPHETQDIPWVGTRKKKRKEN